jgi:hypothetical protein
MSIIYGVTSHIEHPIMATSVPQVSKTSNDRKLQSMPPVNLVIMLPSHFATARFETSFVTISDIRLVPTGQPTKT